VLEPNRQLGILSADKADAIDKACTDIIKGELHEHFVVDMIQGGAGTSSNMNANEVIANRALEYLGAERGQYHLIHPNEDVNQSQSTNDVYPTAARLAIINSTKPLILAVENLVQAFEEKSESF
jgi:aspartate ammonia-lyase